MIIRGVANDTGTSFNDVRDRFKGIPTTDLKGRFITVDEQGTVVRGNPTPDALDAYRDLGFSGNPAELIDTP